MKFTLYTANCTGNEKNVLYPNQKVITSEADLKKAVVYDHVCAQYENLHRCRVLSGKTHENVVLRIYSLSSAYDDGCRSLQMQHLLSCSSAFQA